MIKRYKATENDIDILAKILINDGVISVPTDTVYGVCARINSNKAFKKLVDTKNRPLNKAFPIMCCDEEQLKSIAFVDESIEKIIKAFMPGPITLILNKKDTLHEYINNVNGTIAVRMATSKTLEQLIRKVGCPLYMSSANQSGNPVCTSLDEIEKSCPNLDGMLEGTIQYNMASTIVDCTSSNIKILREGPIKLEDIIDILMDKVNKM